MLYQPVHATGCAWIMLLRRCDDKDVTLILAMTSVRHPDAIYLAQLMKREKSYATPYPQHLCCWIGGHFTEPKEQNTQQSPGLGRSKVLQLLHS